MKSGVKIVGGVPALFLLLALQPGTAQESFPSFDDLTTSNVALLLEGFYYPGGMSRAQDGNPTCNGTEWLPLEWSGSAVIVDADGTMFTNWHVAGRAVGGVAKFHSGSFVPVRHIKAYDPLNDLATLQIIANQDFVPVALGDSDTVRPLDRVLAVGNPRGTGINVTEGGVSQVVQDDRLVPLMVRHTAPIAEGNSGGALYRGGEVIGINVATWPGTQFHQAVPVNKAKDLLRFSEPVLLSSVFSPERAYSPNDLEHLDAVDGSLEPRGSAGVIRFLPGLTDYVFVARTADDANVDIIITNSQDQPIGCAGLQNLGSEVLIKTIDYPQEVKILILSSSDHHIPVILDIYRVKW